MAAYAIVGGVPEYYEWLEPELSLIDNMCTRVLKKPSPFLVEGRFLLYTREQPALHLSIIEPSAPATSLIPDPASREKLTLQNHSIINGDFHI